MALLLDVADGVAVCTLDRPEVLNAFDHSLGTQLVEAVRDAAADPVVRCIVITGSGRAFSSGEDLGALSADYEGGSAPDLAEILKERYIPLIHAVRSAPKPVVAAVNGVAAGAGASLALACDLRLATVRAKFVLAFVNVGLVPDSGALWFLARMIGTARAWQLASTGKPLGAEEARDLGLVDEVVPDDEFEQVWRTRALALAGGPTRAYALTKQLVNAAAELPLADYLAAEADAQGAAGRTQDHLEGVAAFVEKRPPRFRGT